MIEKIAMSYNNEATKTNNFMDLIFVDALSHIIRINIMTSIKFLIS
jgi:hypothetical protein